MYRSPWELATYVRHHIAELTDECRAYAPIARSYDGPARIVTQLRHRLGIGLIRTGHALAGYDAVRALPMSSVRPATWGSGS